MPFPPVGISRRHFLLTTGLAAVGAPLRAAETEPVIDIHQHTNYHKRGNAELIAHQKAIGNV